MAQRQGGGRRKTRGKFRKNIKDRGKISIKKYFQEFKNGDRVILKAEPAVQTGMYFRRFHGKVGEKIGKKGECYIINIKDFNMNKELIVHPIHLKRL
mgnify:FL=1